MFASASQSLRNLLSVLLVSFVSIGLTTIGVAVAEDSSVGWDSPVGRDSSVGRDSPVGWDSSVGRDSSVGPDSHPAVFDIVWDTVAASTGILPPG